MARRSIALLFVLSGLAAQPVLAHDSASGAPDVTITVTTGLSDRDVQVGVGAIVRFRNADSERHRFRSRNGRGFDTGDIEPGAFAQVRLSAAGAYAFVDERTDDARHAGRIVVSGSSSGSGRSTRSASSTGSTSTPRRTATVTIGDRIFQPSTTRIAAGGSVTFRNADRDTHTATGGIIDSGPLRSGAAYRQTFAKPGSYDFLCLFHPDMRGTVEVIGATKPTAPWQTPTATPTPAPTPDATAPPAGSTAVGIVDLAFQPASLAVPVGTTVRWTNNGIAPHTATAQDGAFDSGILETGDVFDHTFASPGTYAYQCQIHPEMTGSIAVTADAAAAAPVDPGGTAPVASAGPAHRSAPPEQAIVARSTAVDARPAADISALGGIGLAVLLVSVASGLFARLLRGTVRT